MCADESQSNAEFYKQTVFLPKTEFDMRAKLPDKEPGILQQWQDMDLYNRLREQSRGREKFILHDGPPFANGHLHMGHAINKVLKDIINRAWQMRGYDAAYVPGWDCHGLPIEWKIEEDYREAGKNKDEVEPVTFRAECRDFADKWVSIQAEEFQRLGVIGDWANPYLTMSYKAEADIVREIHKFLDMDALYKGVRPVMWSPVEKTALADAEIEYKEHKSITVWVRFPVHTPAFGRLEGASVIIWTTTPWTLPSNRAVAYGRDIEYGLYEVMGADETSRAVTGETLIIATDCAEAVREQAGITDLRLLETFEGKDLEGTICHHPLHGHDDNGGYDFDVPLLEGEFVDTEQGTGLVHIAPGHGTDDFYLGRAHGLEVTDNVDESGTFRESVPLFAGTAIYDEQGNMGDANPAVLRALNEASGLLAKGSMRHDYPHSWRSKAPLIFRTTAQWFIALDGKMTRIREKAMDAIRHTRWLPPQGENRIAAMVEQRPDWCISRQRAWGVPIALFMHKRSGEILKDGDVNERIAQAFEAEGADAWWTRDAQDFLGESYDKQDYEQVFDIVDVWFESGATHAFVLEQREALKWPADLYLEGSDQHRGWFQSSLLESCGTRGRAPYDAVLTHGFILDDRGYKMSKSMGNVTAPQDVTEQYGADIMRLWAATSDYSEDVRIGREILKSTTDIYRRMRNTIRFLLGALTDFSEDEKIDADDYAYMPELERLMLHWLHDMDQRMQQRIANYEFSKLIHELHNFCANELSAFYFDIRKDRLYCDRPDLFERRATRTVLMHIFEALSAWLAPYLAFTMEEAWQKRPQALWPETESVHLRDFPEMPDNWRDKALAEKWDLVQKIRRVVLHALEPHRKEGAIRANLEAHPVIYLDDSQLYEQLADLDFAEICITSQATLTSETPADDAFQLEDTPGVAVAFHVAEGRKCQRCWKILPEVGEDPDYPDLSPRDAEAVRWYLKNQQAA